MRTVPGDANENDSDDSCKSMNAVDHPTEKHLVAFFLDPYWPQRSFGKEYSCSRLYETKEDRLLDTYFRYEGAIGEILGS